ncbi:hypothetical protein [Scytonema millei]|uniref:Uncharacterized protein n=1 Tax=Scytonema millei VB511283 TaxID=1245923 RepID=A0A9X5E9N8_9CYAN|nr:hypothetical protein [Scytonema millei]NHC37353.1 hypothetical protein [Scytonema millei VB511283]
MAAAVKLQKGKTPEGKTVVLVLNDNYEPVGIGVWAVDAEMYRSTMTNKNRVAAWCCPLLNLSVQNRFSGIGRVSDGVI